MIILLSLTGCLRILGLYLYISSSPPSHISDNNDFNDDWTARTSLLHWNAEGRRVLVGFVLALEIVIALLHAVVSRWLSRRIKRRYYQKYHLQTVSIRDFTVEVHGLPKWITRQEVVDAFEERWGAVEAVSLAMNTQRLSKHVVQFEELCNKVEDLHLSVIKYEYDQQKLQQQQNNDGILKQWIRKISSLMYRINRMRLNRLRDQLQKLRIDIENDARIRSYRCAGIAFVTFKTHYSRQKCFQDIGGGVGRRVWRIATCQDGEQRSLGGRALTARHPPGPSAVIWRNLPYGALSRAMRHGVSVACCLVVVVLGFGVMLGLERLKTEATGDEDLNDGFLLARPGRYLAFLVSAAVFVINKIIVKILNVFCDFEKHHFENRKNRSLFYKMTYLQYFNTAFAATYANARFSGEYGVRPSFFENLFMIFLSNNLLSFVFQGISYPKYWFMSKWKTRSAKNQRQLDEAVQRPVFPFRQRFAFLVTMCMTAVTWGIVFPLAPLMMAVLLIPTYLIDSFNLRNVCRVDHSITEQEDHTWISAMRMISFAYCFAAIPALSLLFHGGRSLENDEVLGFFLVVLIVFLLFLVCAAAAVCLPSCCSSLYGNATKAYKTDKPIDDYDIQEKYNPPIHADDLNIVARGRTLKERSEAARNRFTDLKTKARNINFRF